MSKIIFVTSKNCELCSKALKKIKPLTYFLPMTVVDVSDGYDEYLLRIPVLLKNEEVIDEGIFNIWKICLLYTSPSPRDYAASRMPSSA